MKTKMIAIENNEPVVSTLVLAEGFGVQHRAILQTIRKYESHFSDIGIIDVCASINKRGKQSPFYNLNEEQSAFLGTLLKNTDQVVGFKKKLTQEFFKIRKALSALASQKQNAEWLEKRSSGKITRREQTDTIKRFIEYAKAQGSQSADMYYQNISKMQNQALFLLDQKYPNLRNVLNLNQLSVIECADRVVSKALVDGMERAIHYKDIYKLAKTKIETLAEVIGKTTIPAFQLTGTPTNQLQLAM